MTRDAGCFYTQEEVREFAAWCRERHVMLIPEIDLPGHSAAFERAMGFSMQTPEGKAALKTIFDELCGIFDGPYVHIGTDEVHFTDTELVPEIVSHIRSHGKKVISWNPGWHYEPGEIDMTQLWSYRGRPQPGIPAIDCRLHYIFRHVWRPGRPLYQYHLPFHGGQRRYCREHRGALERPQARRRKADSPAE